MIMVVLSILVGATHCGPPYWGATPGRPHQNTRMVFNLIALCSLRVALCRDDLLQFTHEPLVLLRQPDRDAQPVAAHRPDYHTLLKKLCVEVFAFEQRLEHDKIGLGGNVRYAEPLKGLIQELFPLVVYRDRLVDMPPVGKRGQGADL